MLLTTSGLSVVSWDGGGVGDAGRSDQALVVVKVDWVRHTIDFNRFLS